MRYIKVIWHHKDPDIPVLLYSELNSEGYETRKVEIYADGHRGFADPNEELGSTYLGTAPIPRLEEMAADAQFMPAEISAEEFERQWSNRRGTVQ